MHRHHISDEPGSYRGWLRFALPDNPVCWLFGHSPKVTIHESKFASIEPWLSIECRVCDRRYHDDALHASVMADVPVGERHLKAKEIAAARVANARRLPAREFLAGVDRRQHWAPREVELHQQTLWPAKGKRRFSDRGFSVKLHLGNRGSETPIDAHAQFGPFAVYVTIGGIGGRLCELVGRGHKRDLQLSAHGGSLWWKLWHDDDNGYDDGAHKCDKWRRPRLWPWSAGRKKYRSWMCLRDGSIELNPASALWGRASFHRTKIGDRVTAAVQVGEFPGDTYLVGFQLEHSVRHRDHGPRWARRVLSTSYDVDWDTRGLCNGIPVRNHDWKGDEVLASGVALPDGMGPDDDWLTYAVARVVEQVKGDRRRYGYVPPKGAEL